MLQNGLSVPYDWLVLALGSETNTFGVPGVKELALPFSTYSDAVRVGASLDLAQVGNGACSGRACSESPEFESFPENGIFVWACA